MAEFRQASGFGETLDVFEEIPLPWVLIVTPGGESAEGLSTQVDSLVTWLEDRDQVDLVQVDHKWLQRLDLMLRLGDALISIMTVLFSLAVVVVVANTIRLDVASRAEEIQVLSLVGASNGFIRQPFLYSGFLVRAVGCACSRYLLLGASLMYLARPVEGLMDAYGHQFSLATPGFAEHLLLLDLRRPAGPAGSCALSVERYLRQMRRSGRLGRV